MIIDWGSGIAGFTRQHAYLGRGFLSDGSIAVTAALVAEIHSIREQVVQQITLALGSIAVANGFFTDLDTVHRVDVPGFELGGYPAIVIRELPATKVSLEAGTPFLDSFIDLEFGLWVRSHVNPPRLANRLLADLETALLFDPTQGGYAVDTQLLDNVLIVGSPQEVLGLHLARARVWYQHQRADGSAGFDTPPGGTFPITAPARTNAEPVREALIQQLKTVLETISVANGYQNDVQKVLRVSKPPTEMELGPLGPVLVIVESREDPREGEGVPWGMVKKLLEVTIFVWIRDTTAPATKANQVLMDVEKAVLLDPLLGGDAITTRPLGNDPEVTSPGEPFGLHQARFQVEYRQDSKDPTLAR